MTRFSRVQGVTTKYATVRSKSVESLRESNHWDDLLYKMQDDYKREIAEQEENLRKSTKAD